MLLAYGLFKYVANYDKNDGIKLICQSFLAVGVVFGTVAIPLALDDQWTAAAWALEGSALVWVALRQFRILPYVTGIALQVGAAWFVVTELIDASHSTHLPLLNGAFLSGLLVSIAGLLSAYLTSKHKENYQYYTKELDAGIFLWGMTWWLLAGVYEIHHHSSKIHYLFWLLSFFTIPMALAHILGRKLRWQHLRRVVNTYIGFLLMTLVLSDDLNSHPFAHYTGFAWVLSLTCYYWILKRNNVENLSPLMGLLHAAGLWLMTMLITIESHWWVKQSVPVNTVWPFIIWIMVPAVVLLFCSRAHDFVPWPFRQHKTHYLRYVCAPLAVYLFLIVSIACIASNGNSAPIDYLPLLNPLDIAQLFALLIIIGWLLTLKNNAIETPINLSRAGIYGSLAGLLFLMINSALIRTIHHWYQVPLTTHAMMHSNLAQTSLTLLWSLMAMGIMVTSSRRIWRKAWIVGAILLGVVVIKLFAVDLANVGTIERIISFIGVGIMMLVIGYFTPLPPKQREIAHA